MTRWERHLSIAAAFAMAAAACAGGSHEELTLTAYVAEMAELAEEFGSSAPEGFVDFEDYPVGGDLVPATELYTVYDDLLASWRSLNPPAEIADLHLALVGALEELQTKVGDYLMDEALQEGELDFETIGAEVGSEILTTQLACNDLRSAVSSRLGRQADVFGDCEF